MNNIASSFEFSPPSAAEDASEFTPEKRAHRLRQRRQALAVFCGSYVLDGILLFAYAAANTTPYATSAGFMCSGLLVMAAFFAISESGWTNRFRDHYLVVPVVLSNVILIFVFMFKAPEVGIIFIAALFLLFTYASIRLTAIGTLVGGSVSLAGLTAFMILTNSQLGIPQETLPQRVIFLAVFMAFFIRAIMVGVLNRRLRSLFYNRGLQLQDAYRRIKESADLDELTGAFNRRYIMAALDEEINRSARGSGPCSVVLIDLDWFKKINDEHGHPIGDEVLRTFAISVFANIRSIDKFSRYGGEEFLILLPETSAEAAVQTIDRLRKIIAGLDWSALASHIKVTISAGVTTLTTDDDVDNVLMRVDHALYRAKREGRNRVCNNTNISKPSAHENGARLAVRESSGQKL